MTFALQRDFAAAASAYQRAYEAMEASVGADDPYLAFPLDGLGQALAELGRYTEAVEHLERALRLRAGEDVPTGQRANTEFGLAQALWDAPTDAGRDRQRARQLAEHAREGFQQAGPSSIESLESVEAWLANRP